MMRILHSRTSLLLRRAATLLQWVIFIGIVSSCSGPLTAGNSGEEPILHYRRFDPILPAFDVTVFPNRVVSYTGLRNARKMGSRRYKISERQYEALLREFRELRFQEMREEYLSPIVDGAPVLEVTWRDGEVKKTVVAHPYGFARWPDNLFKLLWAIESTLELRSLLCPAAMTLPDGRVVDRCVEATRVERKAMERGK